MKITLEMVDEVINRTHVSYKIAKEALETNRGVYELVLEKKLLSKEALDELLKPENMINPAIKE